MSRIIFTAFITEYEAKLPSSGLPYVKAKLSTGHWIAMGGRPVGLMCDVLEKTFPLFSFPRDTSIFDFLIHLRMPLLWNYTLRMAPSDCATYDVRFFGVNKEPVDNEK